MLKRSEQWIATQLARDNEQFRVAESPRNTPCDYWKPNPTPKNKNAGDWLPCDTPIRVKIKEPGMYSRLCPKCEEWCHYSLSPMQGHEESVLVFRWVSQDDYDQWMADQLSQCDTEAVV